MKKLIILFLGVCMVFVFFTGCSSRNGVQNSNTPPESRGLSGKTLRVGTMAVTIGVPVQYAQDKGYFKDAGLDVEIVLFASGAPINEAMAANELDVAVSGMASVYALATGMYTYISDGSITLEGEAIYARGNSDIAAADGVLPDTKGSAKTVKGKSILGPLATTAHFMAIKYAESFGLTENDFNMVSMEYPQAYQAFIMGEGDLLATKPPYTTQLEEAGYVQVCSVATAMGSALVNATYTQNKVFNERYEDLKVFLECYFRACEELNNDLEMRKEYTAAWYAENGVTYSTKDMDSEMTGKIYHTLDTICSEEYPFGLTMTSVGEFFTKQGMIEKSSLPNITESINSSIVEELKAEKNA